MKKDIYEKPNIELISLLNIDIITESSGEGGDVDPVSNEGENNSNSAGTNEVDASPWTKNDSLESHGIFDRFWNIFDEISSGSEVQDNTPIDEGGQEEVPVEQTPTEDNNVDDSSNDWFNN